MLRRRRLARTSAGMLTIRPATRSSKYSATKPPIKNRMKALSDTSTRYGGATNSAYPVLSLNNSATSTAKPASSRKAKSRRMRRD